MKKIFLSFFIFFIVCIPIKVEAEVKVLKTKVFMGNVRSFPSVKHKILFLVKKGDIVTSTLKTGKWYYIEKNSRNGWAHQSLFEREIYTKDIPIKFDFFKSLSFNIKTKVKFTVYKPKITISILRSKEDIDYWDDISITSKVRLKKNKYYKITFRSNMIGHELIRIGCVLYKQEKELKALKCLTYPHIDIPNGDSYHTITVRVNKDGSFNMSFLLGHVLKNTTIQLYNINIEEIK